MPLIGNTKTYDLTSVIQFLSENSYSGTLFFNALESGEKEAIYLLEGNLKIPYGITGNPIFQAEAPFISSPGSYGTEEEKEIFLKEAYICAEEAIYEKFFMDAVYRFEKEILPVEIRLGEYPCITLPTSSILMESSRRMDDLNLIQENIPLEGTLFQFTGVEEKGDNLETLSFLDGSRDVKQIAQDAEKSRYTVFSQLSKLLKENRGRILDSSEYLPLLETFLQQKKLRSVVQIIKHILNMKNTGLREECSGILTKYLDVWQNQDVTLAFQGAMCGSVFTYLIKILIASKCSAVFEISWESQNLVFTLEESSLYAYSDEIDFPMVVLLSLASKSSLPDQVIQSLKDSAPFSISDILNAVTSSGVQLKCNWDNFLINKIVDILAPLFNQTLQISVYDPEEYVFPCSMPFEYEFSHENNVDMFEILIDQWLSVRDEAPPDLSIFTASKKAKTLIVDKSKQDEMTKFLRLFFRNKKSLKALYLTVQEKIGASEFFFKTVAQIAALNLRPFEEDECKQFLKSMTLSNKYEEALKLVKSAEAMGFTDPFFKITKEDIRLRMQNLEEGDRLIGDLKSFSLAEVLQNLVTNQRTGTLRISSSHADQEIYFYRGEVFILKLEDLSSEDSLGTFVEDSAIEGLDFFASTEAQDLDEDELYDELAEHTQEQIYEIFLWDDATFTFILEALPPEFFEEKDHITKLELNTMSFLMGAVSRLEEWSEISRIIISEKAIFKFLSSDYKKMAIEAGMDVQILYLIDGSHHVDDLIRISGRGKFEVCSILYDLHQGGYIGSLEVNELIQRGKEAYQRKDFPLSRKYYAYASLLNPQDPRIGKIIDGLTRKISNRKI